MKTSDHRPVGALFDVNMLQIDENKRESVYQSVVGTMGPPDATVLVSVDGDSGRSFPEARVEAVLRKVAELGNRVLVVK